jgi:transposase InsO family protein
MPQNTRLSWEQKLRFVLAARQAQVSFRELCGAWQISRQSGYKWLRRYQAGGLAVLQEKSRAPRRRPQALPVLWVQRIEHWRRKYPRWGPKKLRAVLRRAHPRSRLPAASTIGRSLRRSGLVLPRRRRLPGPLLRPRQPLPAHRPNDVWTVDFKGNFTTSDGQRVYPLTVRDLVSRFGLLVQMLPGQKFILTQKAFIRLFKRQGQPHALRMDNGSPFGSPGARGLSSLSAWFITLGIEVQFTRRGHPEDNGSHEQWHRVLKAETTRPPASHSALQAARTTRWLKHYNQERPHEALNQSPPAAHYYGSPIRYRGSRPPRYPKNLPVRRVHQGGEIKWQGRLRFVGEAFAGYLVALKRQQRGISKVYFYHALLGHLHDHDLTGIRTAAHRYPAKGPRKV